MEKFSLSLIQHEVSGAVINQRVVDGYIDATALCRAASKHWHNYIGAEQNGHFVRALCESTEMARHDLIHEVPVEGEVHVWVHPQLAINLAQWLSAKFAVQVSEWVLDWKTGGGAVKAPLPYHINRYMLNVNQVPAGHFSILQEMTFFLIGPLEFHGYELPEHMLPDISMGRFLCKHLREKLGVDTMSLPGYTHIFADGRKVGANAYPEEYLAEFRRFIREEWWPKHAMRYFKERDSSALPYLEKLMLLPPPKPPKVKVLPEA
jgi:hypothetical protein